ncbi:MAG TPA: hypothetical protein ENJ95_23280 [Bacteroidetes bacterium]|nr:hypothetical protein [Bacteroidota bacterium]
MRHKIYRILLLLSLALMSAFMLVPPAHCLPDNNRFAPEVVYLKPPVDTLTLSISDALAKKGEEVCVSVTAKNFDHILTMQYTVQWDAKVLKLKEIKDFGLEGMDKRNFGMHLLDKGMLTFSWYDHQLKGITKDDGTELYKMCFEAIGETGSETSIAVSSKPTVVEISNAAGLFLDLRSENGEVAID